MTPRELVYETLEFRNKAGRAPRHMWTLPWAEMHHGEMISRIHTEYPDDFEVAPEILSEKTIEEGSEYRGRQRVRGRYIQGPLGMSVYKYS